jgi:hypothetical protein
MKIIAATPETVPASASTIVKPNCVVPSGLERQSAPLKGDCNLAGKRM